MKKRINISLDEATAKQLKKLAGESHKNVSQWISDAVWKEENLKKIDDKDGNKKWIEQQL